MAGLVAQVQSNPCTSTFFSALVQLIPCRAAVAPFSPIPPNDACCNALKGLGQPCLCVLVNGPPISGVDRNMASQLPEKCTANFDPSLTPLRVSFLGPQFATRLTISLSLSLPQLACDLSTLASTVSPFPYPSQTLREKVTSFSLARTCRPSLHVASLSCTLRLPKSLWLYCVTPLSCL
ncbi:hypothetical protein D0Y65_020628 [Glycine soja]|uniref:Bifunctional inhibitor/plant lipid transfer protein/seed storage helical domain-containing protein n=1 Tax=Glycine soja TaxID=3848 RepID=A0A445JF29_GLYSO|nr:hypothetical protein D0Y65_020628 [Glycine soja]